jgi:hypothetical protein
MPSKRKGKVRTSKNKDLQSPVAPTVFPLRKAFIVGGAWDEAEGLEDVHARGMMRMQEARRACKMLVQMRMQEARERCAPPKDCLSLESSAPELEAEVPECTVSSDAAELFRIKDVVSAKFEDDVESTTDSLRTVTKPLSEGDSDHPARYWPGAANPVWVARVEKEMARRARKVQRAKELEEIYDQNWNLASESEEQVEVQKHNIWWRGKLFSVVDAATQSDRSVLCALEKGCAEPFLGKNDFAALAEDVETGFAEPLRGKNAFAALAEDEASEQNPITPRRAKPLRGASPKKYRKKEQSEKAMLSPLYDTPKKDFPEKNMQHVVMPLRTPVPVCNGSGGGPGPRSYLDLSDTFA